MAKAPKGKGKGDPPPDTPPPTNARAKLNELLQTLTTVGQGLGLRLATPTFQTTLGAFSGESGAV